MSNEKDVIIVGAGTAGLSAAKELEKLGLTYVVVEAAHRTGGRAYSEEIAPDIWFDHGCAYLHHGASNPLVPIADALGVGLNWPWAGALSNAGAVWDGHPLSDQDATLFEQYLEACDARLNASVARGEDQAVSEFVDTNSRFYVPYKTSMETLNAADIDQISTIDQAGFHSDNEVESLDIPVPGGLGTLIQKWSTGVDVSLGCPVTQINWAGPGVEVETPNGTIQGKVALITVSTGVLAAGSIRFDPVLPDWKTNAYLSLPTGTVNKINLRFKAGAFAPDDTGAHMVWRSGGEGAFVEVNLNGHNSATVFTRGTHSRFLESEGPDASRRFGEDMIADVFGSEIRKQITDAISTSWGSDPLTRGAYSCALPGQAHQRRELARPIDERLFFAGEATIDGAQGTCHGAYETGIRAASAIAKTLGNQMPPGRYTDNLGT